MPRGLRAGAQGLLALTLGTLAGTLHGPVAQIACGVLALAMIGVLAWDSWRSRTREELVGRFWGLHMLRRLLRDGLRLQGSLASPAEDALIADGDPVCLWARDTWKLLEPLEPVAAKRFYGSLTPYRLDYFKVAYSIESKREGRHRYLNRRIEILKEAISEVRATAS